MIALVLAAALAADGGTGLPDGGEYVVLDVNHGALWLNQPDGGVSDAPVAVRGGAYLDDDALMHAGRGLAFGRGALATPPDVDSGTVLRVAFAMLGVGVLAGLICGVLLGMKLLAL